LFIEVSSISGANVTGTFGAPLAHVSWGIKNPYSSNFDESTIDLITINYT
jgi:hypothetical protein